MAKRKTTEPASEMIAVPVIPPRTEVPLACQKEKLAILGTASPTRAHAPYADASYEIWGLGVTGTYSDVKRTDVVFEMHTAAYWDKDPNVKKRLQETKVPVYMWEHHDDIPTSIKYPLDVILQYRKYHTNSITYMMALAYHCFLTTEKPKRVELYGIHMAAREEYQDQRPCCEYWIGLMEGAGMEVKPSEEGALLKGDVGLYGLENYSPACFEIRQRIFGLTAGTENATDEILRWQLQKAKNEGATVEAEHWLLKFQRGEL